MLASSDPLAVLVSGGLDSAVLLAEATRFRPRVHPIYIRTGMRWEEVEHGYLTRFLNALSIPGVVTRLTILDMPMGDLYQHHWSVTGAQVPGADSPDEAVYLPGRNVALLSKVLIWCHMHGVPEVALAPLSANPFPDATPTFFRAFEGAVNLAMAGSVRISWPYLDLDKVAVIRRGREFPLEHTFSCIRPVRAKHCGECNKCAERHRGFVAAGVSDPTEYAKPIS